MTLRRCRGCNRLLPLERFWRQRRAPDGFNPRCKDCPPPPPDKVKPLSDKVFISEKRSGTPETKDRG